MSASPAKAECIKPTIAACTKIEDASLAEQRNDKRNKLVVLDFSGCKGAYMLPYEFRAKDIDEHQEQSNMAEHSSVNDEHQDQENAAEQSSTDKERPSEIHSGNPTEIYSGNPSEIYSGNPTEIYSGNPSETYSGNPTKIYLGNPSEIYSDNPSDEARDPE